MMNETPVPPFPDAYPAARSVWSGEIVWWMHPIKCIVFATDEHRGNHCPMYHCDQWHHWTCSCFPDHRGYAERTAGCLSMYPVLVLCPTCVGKGFEMRAHGMLTRDMWRVMCSTCGGSGWVPVGAIPGGIAMDLGASVGGDDGTS